MTIDEMIAVLEAFKRGESLEYYVVSQDSWVPTYLPMFNFATTKYRIAPTKPKNVKLVAFIDNRGLLCWIRKELYCGDSRNRVPAEDKEIEL